MKTLLLGLSIGAVLGAIAMAVFLERRADWLSRIEFDITRPPVPFEILDAIRKAEAAHYARAPAPRRVIEAAQDMLAFLSPALTYRLNLSVGRYRMKAQTVELLIPWAEARGFLSLKETPQNARYALAYFAEQPGLNDWMASTLLALLREDHPDLRDLPWETIAADPNTVAKLYSGYMGAGGDWDGWRATPEPGPEAKRRMGLAP